MTKAWWKEGVVYQIYPRSFQDSNGDGIGDLRGIIDRLDYLKALGVDIVWLSPVYESPNDDNGYDISDYQAIMAEFGTMADFDALLEGLHARGIRLVMDLVVNHTSDEHPWFVESRSAKDSPKRDWYVWRPARPDGSPPNNWLSFFSGSTWEWDEATGEYYLHLFSKKQPDLNWENPAVREAVHAMMRWWLDKGIDGFRMDVINLISKVPGLPDAPVTVDGPWQPAFEHFVQGPRLVEFLAEMKREVLGRYDIITVGEAPLATVEHGIALTHGETGSLNMLFQFAHMDVDRDPVTRSKWTRDDWSLVELKQAMTSWQQGLEGQGWNSLYLANHDQPRPVSRFGDDGRYRVESAKLLATYLHLLQGTPYIYQGEEIGMTNVAFASIEDYRDIETLNMHREAMARGLDEGRVMAMIRKKSRDNARTPMQWSAGPNAGFTTGTPWIGVNPNHDAINVEAAMADPDSVFHHYRRLIDLRKALPVVVHGRYVPLLDEHATIAAYLRVLGDDRLLVVCNFSGEPTPLSLPDEVAFTSADLLIANYPVDLADDLRRLTLRPWEARVHRLTG
jgi:oligo-1,6-glucosidase